MNERERKYGPTFPPIKVGPPMPRERDVFMRTIIMTDGMLRSSYELSEAHAWYNTEPLDKDMVYSPRIYGEMMREQNQRRIANFTNAINEVGRAFLRAASVSQLKSSYALVDAELFSTLDSTIAWARSIREQSFYPIPLMHPYRVGNQCKWPRKEKK